MRGHFKKTQKVKKTILEPKVEISCEQFRRAAKIKDVREFTIKSSKQLKV